MCTMSICLYPSICLHPSICLYNILLNIKYDSLVAKDRRSLNSLFFQTMNNVAAFKKIVSATFNGFFKGDVSKK